MKALASFIMRGFPQAAVLATTAALASLIVPLTGMVSAASVGLVTMRLGASAGLFLSLLATFVSALFLWLALGSPWSALGFTLLFWLPLVAFGWLLRSSRSLALVVQLTASLALICVVLVHLTVADPAVLWQQWLEPLRLALIKGEMVAAADSQRLMTVVAGVLTGALAAAMVMHLLASLFLARWWQALLYNPGGFGKEFRRLRLARLVGAVFLALVLWLALVGRHPLIADFVPVLATLLLIQGLAVAHAVRDRLHASGAWLFGLYLSLILLWPQATMLVVGLGLVDQWLDVRTRVARRTRPEIGDQDPRQ